MSNKEFILSPSSLNTYLKDPALWILKHFYGLTGGSNIYSVRGKMVEKYVNMCLTKQVDSVSFLEYHITISAEELKKPENFVLNIKGIAKAYLVVDGIAVKEQELREFYEWGRHAHRICKHCFSNFMYKGGEVTQQRRVLGEINRLKIGGYLDYDLFGVATDLKTCNKLPIIVSRGEREGMISKTKVDNVRQQVIYQLLTGFEVKLLYVSPGLSLVYDVTQRDIDEVMPSITQGIKEIKNLIEIGKEEAVRITDLGKMGNPFMWTPELKQQAKEIWKKVLDS